MESSLQQRLPPVGETLTDPDAIFDRFLDYVSDLGLELYPAQEEALLEILAGKNVVLNTPTGSGKSLVALAMHFKAMCEDKRSIYTSPVKALVNEKFFSLCEAFHPDNVGLSTGDATVNRDAPILCCTAEILSNMALREGDKAFVDYAILDEFHYYADRDRGVAWQIPLLALPQTRFLLMSATLGDMEPFTEQLTALNGHDSVVVTSDHRPVPLDYAYFESSLHDTVTHLLEKEKAPIYLVNFTQRECHSEAQNMMSINVVDRDTKKLIAQHLQGYRFDTPYGKTIQRFVRHGIGIHHGGMLPKHRRLVERLAQKGLLKVISGTDTLGVGVNIPIRTVVFTKLCKFDGRRVRILSVRDFKQICGRAGRKGFDDQGSVVAQAPEHAVENLRLEAKASRDAGKRKKIVRKKPPTKGYVHWDKGTFDQLRNGKPEQLESRFKVSHAMILNVLSREHGGCDALKKLILGCHDRRALRQRHGKTAFQMFRSLVAANVVTFVPNEDGRTSRVQVNVDLQKEFSLHHTLSLYAVETIRKLDREAETYPLDVLSLVEAVLEDPKLILAKQLDRIKTAAIGEMKAAGMDYDERMEELEKLEYPKPNQDFIYGSFNEFAAKQPWSAAATINPKGVAREMYEECFDFNGFVKDFKLERAEGLVLRYMTEVYKALVQCVPNWALTVEVEDMIDYFSGVVRGVDASLVQEWEQLRDPDYVPIPVQAVGEPEPERGISGDVRSFTVLVRNRIFRVVRALAARDYAAAASLVDEAWTAERFETELASYYDDHQFIRGDTRARGTEFTRITPDERRWNIDQFLVDPDDHNDWWLELVVDLDASDERAEPVLELTRIGR